MSLSSKTDPDLAALQDDPVALKRDVSNLLEHLKAGATNGAQTAAGRRDDGAQRACRNVRGRRLLWGCRAGLRSRRTSGSVFCRGRVRPAPRWWLPGFLFPSVSPCRRSCDTDYGQARR